MQIRGEYSVANTHVHDIAIDYTMNVTVNDININKIESFYCEANGIVIYKKPNVCIVSILLFVYKICS